MTLRKWSECYPRPRLMLVAILFIAVFLWYLALSHTPNHMEHAKQFAESSNKYPNDAPSYFPVLPKIIKKTATPAPTLLEQDVIHNGAVFVANLQKALEANISEPVILSVVDFGFIHMTLNFLKLSIEKNDLRSNFLPVCMDLDSVAALEDLGYSCVLLEMSKTGSLMASDFGTEDYYRKTNIKTWVTYQVLKLGHRVLLSDVDIIYFDDPFLYFDCSNCDVHIQMDKELYNSGFVFVRPTDVSLALYDTAWRYYLQYHKGHDQAYINMAITMLNKNNSLKAKQLSWKQFPCGAYYFEHDYRHFYNEPPCKTCIIAHNNYIGTTAAKVYRFKENLLWTVDDESYYSSPTAKYITYENPYDFGDKTFQFETDALRKALILAKLTKRILILPSFRCCNCRIKTCDHPSNRCSMLSVIKIKLFDEMFKGKYREHSFLRNPAVPSSVKESLSPNLYLNISTVPRTEYKDVSQYVFSTFEPSVTVLHTQNAIATAQHFSLALMKFSSYSVIRIHSLYNDMDETEEVRWDGSTLADHFGEGIKCGLYEQWEESLEESFFGRRT